jgi:aldehyde dehydrogenase (NAD+)
VEATEPRLSGGSFLPPTVFTDVPRSSDLARKEVFGPVLSVFRFRDEAEAIEIGNDTDAGLSAGVWTQNLGRAHRMAAALKAGIISVNEFADLPPQAPFGGWKRSGVGHESGAGALEKASRRKTVIIRL